MGFFFIEMSWDWNFRFSYQMLPHRAFHKHLDKCLTTFVFHFVILREILRDANEKEENGSNQVGKALPQSDHSAQIKLCIPGNGEY